MDIFPAGENSPYAIGHVGSSLTSCKQIGQCWPLDNLVPCHSATRQSRTKKSQVVQELTSSKVREATLGATAPSSALVSAEFSGKSEACSNQALPPSQFADKHSGSFVF